MISLKGTRMSQVLSGSPGDTVVCAFDVPAGCILQGFTGKAQLIGASARLEREVAAGYAMAGVMIELNDPDTADVYDDWWDRFVVKYTDVDTIDLDTLTVDTSPFWEPGEANFQELYDMGDTPRRLFTRKKLMTFADPGSGGFRTIDEVTPFEPIWIPSDSFTFSGGKGIRTRKPSVVMIGVAAPAFDDTFVATPHLLEAEWGRIQYIEATLEDALIDQLGLDEAGANAPYTDASVLLRKYLAPNILEVTSGAFSATAFNVFMELEFRVLVPGKMDFKSVDLTN